MQAATNKPETEEEKIPAKSAGEAQEEYTQLLREYERLRNEVEAEIRQMRGGRILSLQEILARVLKSRSPEAGSSK
jgi:hypothetical protein